LPVAIRETADLHLAAVDFDSKLLAPRTGGAPVATAVAVGLAAFEVAAF
jgi:hypothetical protein